MCVYTIVLTCLYFLRSIGVTLGNVFCGTVGGSIRCEYTLHGTNVNLAARLMVAATEGVLVDEDTYNETKSQIAFGEKQMIKVKGKVDAFPVYRPLDVKWRQEAAVRGQEVSMWGRDKEIKAINFAFVQLMEKTSFPGMALFFVGAMGLGKSRICRFISTFASSRQVRLLEGSGVDTEITVSYFAWKGIFAQLCNFDECLTNEDKLAQLKKVLPSGQPGTVLNLICKIFPELLAEQTGPNGQINLDADNKGLHSLMRDAIQMTVNSYLNKTNNRKANKIFGNNEDQEYAGGATAAQELALSSNARIRLNNTKHSINKNGASPLRGGSERRDDRAKLSIGKKAAGYGKKASNYGSKIMKHSLNKRKTKSKSSVGGPVGNAATYGKKSDIKQYESMDAGASPLSGVNSPSVGKGTGSKTGFKRVALLIDDAHSLDSLSWEALLYIIDECENLLSFVTMRTSERSGVNLYNEIQTCKNMKIYELSLLEKKDVEQIMKELILVEKCPEDASEIYWEKYTLSNAVCLCLKRDSALY